MDPNEPLKFLPGFAVAASLFLFGLADLAGLDRFVASLRGFDGEPLFWWPAGRSWLLYAAPALVLAYVSIWLAIIAPKPRLVFRLGAGLCVALIGGAFIWNAGHRLEVYADRVVVRESWIAEPQTYALEQMVSLHVHCAFAGDGRRGGSYGYHPWRSQADQAGEPWQRRWWHGSMPVLAMTFWDGRVVDLGWGFERFGNRERWLRAAERFDAVAASQNRRLVLMDQYRHPVNDLRCVRRIADNVPRRLWPRLFRLYRSAGASEMDREIPM
ncbi:hypothetical protein Q0812_08035 [Brevundimonas sp. 2R-24]|uniref:Uncharacterized protein n=1 Tax=Peiella sedimenti TaxID=3061083 RepID=A0ABT8SLD8_9CAUL|nr:hypothetical protein [Caulobacteraceae bacterium XZ-24]